MKAKLLQKTVDALKPAVRPYEVCDTELRGFLLRVQPSGKMTYYASYRLADGRRNRVRLGNANVATVSQARDEALKVLGQVASGENPAEARRRGKLLTLEQFLDQRYASYMTERFKTGAYQVERIRIGFAPLLGKRLSDITAWVVEKQITERARVRSKRARRDGRVSNATLNRDLSALKACMQRAADWGLLAGNPLANVRPRKEEKASAPRALVAAEESRLREALKTRDRAIRKARASYNTWAQDRDYPERPSLKDLVFVDYLEPMVLLALNTGLRRGELFALTWECVDLGANSPRLVVRAGVAKDSEERVIPLNREATDVLRQWRDQTSREGLVFKSADGKRFDNVDSSWRGVLKVAGLAVRWHDLRHTFATNLLAAGVDLETVKALCGHANIATTARYLHTETARKVEAVQRLGQPRDNVVPMRPGQDAAG